MVGQIQQAKKAKGQTQKAIRHLKQIHQGRGQNIFLRNVYPNSTILSSIGNTQLYSQACKNETLHKMMEES